jgi:hypothetical protein
MVHVGLDLRRTRLDVPVMDESGAPLAVTSAPPEAGWPRWPPGRARLLLALTAVLALPRPTSGAGRPHDVGMRSISGTTDFSACFAAVSRFLLR